MKIFVRIWSNKNLNIQFFALHKIFSIKARMDGNYEGEKELMELEMY